MFWNTERVKQYVFALFGAHEQPHHVTYCRIRWVSSIISSGFGEVLTLAWWNSPSQPYVRCFSPGSSKCSPLKHCNLYYRLEVLMCHQKGKHRSDLSWNLMSLCSHLSNDTHFWCSKYVFLINHPSHGARQALDNANLIASSPCFRSTPEAPHCLYGKAYASQNGS